MQVPVVVVNLDRADDLKRWLSSVSQLTEGKHKVHAVPFLVDNGSSDASLAVIRQAIADGLLQEDKLIWLPRNYGFTAAQNVALRKLSSSGQYKYIATLNVDAVAQPDWLAELVLDAEDGADPSVSMWASLILQPKRLDRISSAGHCFSSRDGKCYDIDWNVESTSRDASSNQKDFEPFGPCFAASLWTVDVIRNVGLPDNQQFLYYDDIDLAFKARLCGRSSRFVRKALASHPLPGSRPAYVVAGTYQMEGRMGIVSRYYPEPERSRILDNLTAEEKLALDRMSANRKMQYGSELQRRDVFDKWKDRNLPSTKSSLTSR